MGKCIICGQEITTQMKVILDPLHGTHLSCYGDLILGSVSVNLDERLERKVRIYQNINDYILKWDEMNNGQTE